MDRSFLCMKNKMMYNKIRYIQNIVLQNKEITTHGKIYFFGVDKTAARGVSLAVTKDSGGEDEPEH